MDQLRCQLGRSSIRKANGGREPELPPALQRLSLIEPDQLAGWAPVEPAAFTSEGDQFETPLSLAGAPADPLGSFEAAPAVLGVSLVLAPLLWRDVCELWVAVESEASGEGVWVGCVAPVVASAPVLPAPGAGALADVFWA